MNYSNIKQDINKSVWLCLIAIMGLSFAMNSVKAQSKADSCYIVPRGAGLLIQVNKADGVETIVGTLGVSQVQAIAFNNTTDTLFPSRAST